MNIKTDCKYFKGDVPCTKNKEYNVICEDCKYYIPSLKILIIKLGAIGDVIRSTPIITRLLKLYPDAEIYWLTDFPEILPPEINRLKFSFENAEKLRSYYFDIIYNIDKDLSACSLVNSIPAKQKYGFWMLDGKVSPINKYAEHKYLTGVFDNLSKENKKHYVQEIFEICNIGEFNNEEYLINYSGVERKNNKRIIGLNTGCSHRWNTRLWPEDYWVSLSNELIEKGYEVRLLGGELEHNRNLRIKASSGANYFGYGDIEYFIDVINYCDLIVTQVTSALHIAIALKKKIVLMNNIFNPNEFYLYGLGKIVQPETGCDCYYSPDCKRKRHCMKDISVDEILKTIGELW